MLGRNRVPGVASSTPSRPDLRSRAGRSCGYRFKNPSLGKTLMINQAADPSAAAASSSGRAGGAGGGPFSRDRSARRLSLNLRSDRSIRYFPLLPENSILGLELGPRLNLSGNQRGGDRDRDTGRDRDREIVRDRDREMLRKIGEGQR